MRSLLNKQSIRIKEEAQNLNKFVYLIFRVMKPILAYCQ